MPCHAMPCPADLMLTLFAVRHAAVVSGAGGFWDRVTTGGGGGGVQSWRFQGGWDWDRLAQLSLHDDDRPSKLFLNHRLTSACSDE